METLDTLLKGKKTGFFENDNGEYCQINRNSETIKVIFSKGLGEISERGIIKTDSEQKVIELIKEDRFVLID